MSQGKFTGAIGAIIQNINSGKILLLKRSPKKDFIPNTWEEVTGRTHLQDIAIMKKLGQNGLVV